MQGWFGLIGGFAALVWAFGGCASGDDEALHSASVSGNALEEQTSVAGDALGVGPEIRCRAGEIIDGEEGEWELGGSSAAAPLHSPHYRMPVTPPSLTSGWQQAGPPTGPRVPVRPEVVAMLEEYKERARLLSPEEAASLKAEMLGEERESVAE
jgi:hypothetical protein